jgi:hypothetical protein
MLGQNPDECGYPTNDGPAETKIHGKNSRQAFGTTNYGDDRWQKIKT